MRTAILAGVHCRLRADRGSQMLLVHRMVGWTAAWIPAERRMDSCARLVGHVAVVRSQGAAEGRQGFPGALCQPGVAVLLLPEGGLACEGDELRPVVDLVAPQLQEGVRALFDPAHSALVETLGDDVPDGAFGRSGAELEVALGEFCALHAMGPVCGGARGARRTARASGRDGCGRWRVKGHSWGS